MASTGNHPDKTKLIKSNYISTLLIYRKSTGEMLFDFENEPRVKYIIETDDHNQAVMPVIKLGVMLNTDERIIMQENRDDLTFNLKLKRIERRWDDEKNDYEIETEVAELDLEFQAWMARTDDVNLKTGDKETTTEDEDSNKSSSDMKSPTNMAVVDFIITCIKYRNRFKIPINFNMSGSSKSDIPVVNALAYGISTCVKEPKSVIMQLPESDKTFNQIICPPYNLKDFCKHLQLNYGLYKSGLIVFQDLKYLHIIPEFSEDYAVADGEFNSVYIYIYDKQVSVNSEEMVGSYKDDDNSRYVVMQPAQYNFINMDEFEKETIGNKFRILTDEGVDKSVTYEGDTFSGESPLTEMKTELTGSNSTADDRVRHFNNEMNNEMVSSAAVFQTKLGIIQCSMQLRDVNIDIFKYNRLYHIIFNDDSIIDAKYGGTFKLINATKTLSQGQVKNPMTSYVNCVFAKVDVSKTGA